MPNDVPDWTSVALMSEQAIPNSPFSFARNGAGHNITGLQLPVGCQWLCFVTQTPADIANLTITGTTTNAPYAGGQLIGVDSFLYFRVHPSIDPTVNIVVTTPAGAGNMTLGVAFGFAPTVTDLDTVVPSPVFLQDDNLNVIGTTPISAGIKALVVSNLAAPSALWQAPSGFVRFAASVAAGGTVTLLAGVGGQVARVFSPTLTSDAGAGGAGDTITVEDTAGNVIQDFRNVQTLQVGSAGPLPQVTGNGVRVHNFSAAALTVRITFGFTQG